MSFYNTSSPASFSMKKSNRVETAIQDNVSGLVEDIFNICYATFERVNGEFFVRHINLNDTGYFVVSLPGPSQTIEFICLPPYKRVIGTISYSGDYTLSQPSNDRFVFELVNPEEPFFGTLSLMASK